jgi:hypothetical protein
VPRNRSGDSIIPVRTDRPSIPPVPVDKAAREQGTITRVHRGGLTGDWIGPPTALRAERATVQCVLLDRNVPARAGLAQLDLPGTPDGRPSRGTGARRGRPTGPADLDRRDRPCPAFPGPEPLVAQRSSPGWAGDPREGLLTVGLGLGSQQRG